MLILNDSAGVIGYSGMGFWWVLFAAQASFPDDTLTSN